MNLKTWVIACAMLTASLGVKAETSPPPQNNQQSVLPAIVDPAALASSAPEAPESPSVEHESGSENVVNGPQSKEEHPRASVSQTVEKLSSQSQTSGVTEYFPPHTVPEVAQPSTVAPVLQTPTSPPSPATTTQASPPLPKTATCQCATAKARPTSTARRCPYRGRYHRLDPYDEPFYNNRGDR